MERMVAYCGLVCTDCEVYIATQSNDPAQLEAVAEHIRKDYNSPNVTVADVICDGCLGDSGRKGSYCPMCPIRLCAVERGVVNCAYCADYSSCGKFNDFLASTPKARAALEGIRAVM